MYTVAEESGIPVLNVHYLVHFAYFTGETEDGDDKQARISMGQHIRVEDGSLVGLAVGSSGTFNNPNGMIRLTWGELSEMPYGTTKEATSGSQKAANAFSGAIGMLSGGSMSAKEFTITADPAKYRAAAEEVLDRVNAGFVDKMANLK